jgi:hypothetical protein
VVLRTGATLCRGGLLTVGRQGKAAEIPDTEQGATLAHWLGGQWSQSAWAG